METYEESQQNDLNQARPRCQSEESVHNNEFASESFTDNSVSSKTKKKCFNCREQGHYYTNCPLPIIMCRKCFRPGHDLETCERTPKTQPSNVETTDTPKSKETKKICFNCRLVGHHIKECPNPIIICQNCFKKGHDVTTCRRILKNIQPANATAPDTSKPKNTKLKRPNPIMKCQKCFKTGHDVKTCRQIPKNIQPSNIETTDAPKSKERKKICFNCRLVGHHIKDCPNPIIICQNCLKKGHDVTTCRRMLKSIQPANANAPDTSKSKKTKSKCYNCDSKEHLCHECPEPFMKRRKNEDQTDDENPQTLAISTGNIANNKFFKKVIVNGQEFVSFVDFGSECTLMRESEALQLKLPTILKDFPAISVLGNSSGVKPIYKSFISLKVDEVEADVEILVIRDEFLSTPLLIGQDFTELPFVTVLKNSNQLIFFKSRQ